MDKKERKGKLKKSAVRNKYSFHVNESEVIDCTNFGSFEIVRTKKEIIFRTYNGYHIRVTPNCVMPDGSMEPYSLYTWLDDLVNQKIEISGHEDELYNDNGNNITNGEYMENMEIVTVANLTRPMYVFTDEKEALEEAKKYILRILENAQLLKNAINGEVPDDIDEREYAIERANADVIDTMQVISSESGEIGI